MQLLKLYIIICYTIIHKSLNVSSICYIIETIHHYEIYHYTYLCQVSSICHVIETIHAYIVPLYIRLYSDQYELHY
jgi:hypothetical protein